MKNKTSSWNEKPNMDLVASLKFSIKLFLSKALGRALKLAEERKQTVTAATILAQDIRYGFINRTGDNAVYSNEGDIIIWHKYREETEGNANCEVKYRNSFCANEVLNIIKEDNLVKNVINFGSAFGWLENKVAEQASHVHVWGIDRRDVTANLNKNHFKEKPNLHFEAWNDIFDFISSSPAMENSVFIHINTGTYFLPKFLEKLYAVLKEKGCRHIVLFEPSGISRQTGRYFEYSLEERQSVVFRGGMLLNNYPNILSKCGYDIARGGVLSVPHPHPDWRSLHLTANVRQADANNGVPS